MGEGPPLVCVHGVPETASVFDDLARAVVGTGMNTPTMLSPPGFGAALPAGFVPSHTAYVDWLIDELEGIGRPVHLMGHDWGGLHVLGVAIRRPDLVASWVSDTAGILAPDYQWHSLASLSQQPVVGERLIAQMIDVSTPERVSYLRSQDMPAALAHRIAPTLTPMMGDCILGLYRSAVQPAMAELGELVDRASARPGVVVIAGQDHNSGSAIQHMTVAHRARAAKVRFDDLGHWWFHQSPKRVAAALYSFWAAR